MSGPETSPGMLGAEAEDQLLRIFRDFIETEGTSVVQMIQAITTIVGQKKMLAALEEYWTDTAEVVQLASGPAPRCAATTQRGTRCRNTAGYDASGKFVGSCRDMETHGGLCWQHAERHPFSRRVDRERSGGTLIPFPKRVM